MESSNSYWKSRSGRSPSPHVQRNLNRCRIKYRIGDSWSIRGFGQPLHVRYRVSCPISRTRARRSTVPAPWPGWDHLSWAASSTCAAGVAEAGDKEKTCTTAGCAAGPGSVGHPITGGCSRTAACTLLYQYGLQRKINARTRPRAPHGAA